MSTRRKQVPVCIEKGIPIPLARKPGSLSEITAALREMEVGDSITVPLKERNGLGQRLVYERPRRFITRTIDAVTLRIWRIA
jgi:hypothetical protein